MEISDVALECVLNYVDDPCDRDAVSLVCRRWYRIDSVTRKRVAIAFSSSVGPDRLRRRFPRLESLKLKGKPRAEKFNLIPNDWGGLARPWINGVADALICLKSLHLRRMIVEDADICVLVRARGHMLQALMLEYCTGFSTKGLFAVARSCRCLRTLLLLESTISESENGEWLRELATNNSVLENLNFYMTELIVSWQDLELIARNCKSLVSLMISECDVSELAGVFRAATALEEFGGGSFDDRIGEASRYKNICFPPRLRRLGLIFLGTNEMHIVFPVAGSLKKLDLQYAILSTQDHCELIQRCPNLEILEVRDVIGDRGLEVVARTCRKLRRLRIERGEDEQGLEDEQGTVSDRGLSAVAQGCLELEYLAVYVTDIRNSALEAFGIHSKHLCDFRLVLLDREERITELPLDDGVRALLRGCTELRTFALYLRPGGLTDTGLGYIGEYGSNIRWLLLGHVGESDLGLLRLAIGCPKVRKLEWRGCCFSERALALAVLRLASLRYLWVQGYNASAEGAGLLAMVRPFWNIEFIPPRREITCVENDGEQSQVCIEHPVQVLAYYSLAGRRTDCPDTVIPLNPPAISSSV